MAAPKWMDNADQLTLPDVQPHHLEDITKFLELLPKRIHPWCKHTNIIRLTLEMLSSDTEPGQTLYNTAFASFANCEQCVDSYVNSLYWMLDNKKDAERGARLRELEQKDAFRLLKYFSTITALLPVEDPIDESIYTPALTVPLYELTIRPQLLDKRVKSVNNSRNNFYRCLVNWKLDRSNPAIAPTRIAYGVMRLLELIGQNIRAWTIGYKWTDFDPSIFPAHFDRLMTHYETTLLDETPRPDPYQFVLPPDTRFYEAMVINFRKISQLGSVAFLFRDLDIMTRMRKLMVAHVISAEFLAPMMTSLLEVGEIAWSGFSSPSSFALEIIDQIAAPLLNSVRFVTHEVIDALSLIAALVKSAKNFPSTEFVTFMNKIGPQVASGFAANKGSRVARDCIKSICQTYFERKPPLEAPHDIRSVWTSLVEPENDSRLLMSAMNAEASFMRHSILDRMHVHNGTPHRIFPQRMIVASIMSGRHLPKMLTNLLETCASLALLDIKSPKSRLETKQIRYATDILSNLGNAIEKFVADEAAQFTESQLKTVISVAPYYLSSPMLKIAGQKLVIKKVLNSVIYATKGTGSTLEYFFTVENAATFARSLRALLWDLLIFRYKECIGALDLVVDWTSRFIQSEWMIPDPDADPTLDPDYELKQDVMKLAWLLAKFMLIPRRINPSTNPQNNPVGELKELPAPSSASGAIRILMAIVIRQPNSTVSKRAFEVDNIESWVRALLSTPKYVPASDDAFHLSWKAFMARIRRNLVELNFKLSPAFTKALQRIFTYIQPVEWEKVLEVPLLPPTAQAPIKPQNTPSQARSSNQPSIFDSWKKEKPVLNGSALFSGDYPANAYAARETHVTSNYAHSVSKNGHTTQASSSETRQLPPSVQAPKKPKPVVEQVPLGPTVQERKEQDAELQRQQAAKRKREAVEAAQRNSEGPMIVQEAALKVGKTAAQLRKEAHAKARQNRVKSLDELFDKVLGLSFHNLTFAGADISSAGRVPNTFLDVDEYVTAFEPLLLLELQSQLQNAKEELMPLVSSRPLLYLAEFGHCHDLTILGEKKWKSNDVFLMWPKSKAGDPRSELASLQRDASLIPHCLGIFTKDKKKKKGTTLTIEGGTSEDRIVIRVILNNAKDHRSGLFSKVQLGTEWNFCSIYSLSTVSREWQALQSVESLHGIPQILRPTQCDHAGSGPWHPAQLKDLVSKLTDERKFNHSQRNAIDCSLKKTGFSFIQGPPGTGKTRTLLGLLSIIYALQGAPILVCTPSNSAIDEVIERILTQGLYNMSTTRSDAYTTQFKLVRVGGHESTPDIVKAVTLSELVKAQFGTGKAYEAIENSILQSADIVCCTLSTSGSGPLIRANIPFKTVIIDEAAQAVELATLIPLQHQCEKTILIGDPQQLPATVFSTMATQYLYERSLFARFSATMSPDNVLLLNTQYRMHPQISLFPNIHFYKGQLVDGVPSASAPWSVSSDLFSPLRFFDIAQSKTNAGTKSLSNDEEVSFIVNMIHKLMRSNLSISFFDKIVVITPYTLQRHRLKTAFEREAPSNSVFGSIEVCTVDSYQGKEKDIVIFSTVRARRGQSIGFLADVRRMNVALTRAKKSLWIVGHVATLQINSEWKALIKSIDDRDLRTTVDKNPQQWWASV